MMNVTWAGGMVFEGEGWSGIKVVMDASPDAGGQDKGPSPVEALLASVAACSAMDVIAILEKKRQKVTSYRIEVDGDRVPAGTYPRPFTALRVKHILKGENLDHSAVARAVELSDNKYCSVIATLREAPQITSDWEIEID